ncbi:MAG TPA: ribonuclease E/G, partial [Magnetospirillum sp.]|nr:ribonuclease E/G [Magnetospirillum sp.]
ERPFRPRRQYKIQEVIKRRQVMLVQVVKEERGNKGAALTTYLSLAGRYCVLMPNTARGGGVSRKIVSTTDRRRLKAIAQELNCPEGMAVIVRTAGSERSKTEIKRDYEYLLRAWDQVRELTLKSSAPSLVYEEASLIKRSIRDLYSRDIDEVLVDGEEGYRLAKDYMRMLTPSHAKKVQPYKDPTMPMFHRYQVETQLDAMHSPVVQLRSGGYIVISQTEALVAIDVNSGRATKERHIEETALKTNLEAADEVARQLRLRDLAGLIVIDFIDMEESRNNHAVERRLKEALKDDRARIQVGKISAFGLLELSRQRLRPSLQETTFTPCPHCAGTGLVRSVESAAMHVLRAIEEEGIRRRSSEVTVYVPSSIALYILNQKRDALAAIEERYEFSVFLLGDDSLIPPNLRMERVKAENRPEEARPVSLEVPPLTVVEDEEGEEEVAEEGEEERTQAEGEGENGEQRKRRRRRRRKRRPGEQPSQLDLASGETAEEGAESGAEGEEAEEAEEAEAEGEEGDENGEGELDANGERRKRRRGRRGGRRRRRNREGEGEAGEASEAGEQQPVALPSVPGGDLISNPDAVADVFAQAEAAAEAEAAARAAQPAEAPAAEAVAEEKPRRRRARKAEAEAPAAVQAEAQVVAEAPAEAAPAEAEAEAKPKRSRAKKAAEPKATEKAEPKTRSRAKKAEAPAEAAEAEAKPKRSRAKKAAAPEAPAAKEAPAEEAPAAVEAPAAMPAVEATPEPAVAEQPAAEAASAQQEAPAPVRPTRKGWWNRMLS